MPTIRHRVGIAVPQTRLYETLTTLEGISQWWTRQVEGDPQLGGTLRFFFGKSEPSASMKVVELVPSQRVVWQCVQGPDEWVGTHVTFDLASSEGETVLRFTHADWRDPVEFMYHCSTKWAYFLVGMKNWLEGGKATTYPDEVPISSWG